MLLGNLQVGILLLIALGGLCSDASSSAPMHQGKCEYGYQSDRRHGRPYSQARSFVFERDCVFSRIRNVHGATHVIRSK